MALDAGYVVETGSMIGEYGGGRRKKESTRRKEGKRKDKRKDI